jgi:hypothetical protein
MSDWPGSSGMTLITMNKTVRSKTTTIENGDMVFSFLQENNPADVIHFPLINKTLIA